MQGIQNKVWVMPNGTNMFYNNGINGLYEWIIEHLIELLLKALGL